MQCDESLHVWQTGKSLCKSTFFVFKVQTKGRWCQSLVEKGSLHFWCKKRNKEKVFLLKSRKKDHRPSRKYEWNKFSQSVVYTKETSTTSNTKKELLLWKIPCAPFSDCFVDKEMVEVLECFVIEQSMKIKLKSWKIGSSNLNFLLRIALLHLLVSDWDFCFFSLMLQELSSEFERDDKDFTFAFIFDGWLKH